MTFGSYYEALSTNNVTQIPLYNLSPDRLLIYLQFYKSVLSVLIDLGIIASLTNALSLSLPATWLMVVCNKALDSGQINKEVGSGPLSIMS